MYQNRFNPYTSGFLGQEDSSSWGEKASAAVQRYDALMARALALPAGKAKADLMAAFGDVGSSGMSTFPGTPADRYTFVRDAIVSDGPWDSIHQNYVQDLEDADVELETKVAQAESSSSSPFVDPEGRLTGLGWGILGTAAVGLFVVPFLLE